ncbi:hypothetical protein [Shinella sp.]|uniref:hypothetical protein n=1 Tax=Shinella sp. TaxID=1870904 RepID=UPI002898E7A6|nr:hypothetical protein [Shinella sp.]
MDLKPISKSGQTAFAGVMRSANDNEYLSDQAVLVDWDIDKLPSIWIFEKLALCHRPTPFMTNLREALSSRAGQRNQNWRMSMAIHRDRMLQVRTTTSFLLRSALAYDFGLLLF